jgi:tetratricopeptide (TPR) repeat protein
MQLERTILRAQGYTELGMYARARQELATLPLHTFASADVVEIRLLCDMGEHRWEEALKLSHELRRLHPEDPDGCLHEAYCLHELGRTQEALHLLKSGPTVLHQRALYYYNLACYNARLGELEAALQLLNHAFEMDQSLRRVAKKDSDLDALRAQII